MEFSFIYFILKMCCVQVCESLLFTIIDYSWLQRLLKNIIIIKRKDEQKEEKIASQFPIFKHSKKMWITDYKSYLI